MRAVITVVGSDKVGIIHRVTGVGLEHKLNVLDLSQTIMAGGIFTMIMLVEGDAIDMNFKSIGDDLNKLGEEIGVSIRIQRQEVFSAMHAI